MTKKKKKQERHILKMEKKTDKINTYMPGLRPF